MRNCSWNLSTLKSWLSKWWIASIMLSVLLATSCRTTSKNTSDSLTDSLEWHRKVSVTLATIPSSLAELTIPIDSLRNLPEGAVYEKKSGQAGLKVGYKKGQVIASASCDSLQQLVYDLEEKLHRARSELVQKDTVKEAPLFTLKSCLTGFVVGFAVGFIIGIVIRKRKKS